MTTNDILNKISLRDEERDEFASIDKDLEANDCELNASEEALAHSTLVANISQLSSTRKFGDNKWKAKRFEATDDVKEFNLSQTNDKIRVSELVESIKDPTGTIKKRLKHWHRKPVLETPLEKPVSDQLKRKVAYERTAEELSKWDSVVEANRNADQLHFPLKQCDLRMEATRELVKNYAPKTKMELEIAEVLSKSDNVMTETKPLTAAEEKYLKAMSLEEAKLRHRELQKMRALLSYQEAKYKRQSKIKSKSYHRILRRERLKRDMEQFEEQRKSDPEAVLRKLEDLDKLRALERASLKHKNTGKWAKHNKLRAKYDDNARQAMSDQIELSKKLLKKQAIDDSDDEARKEINVNSGDKNLVDSNQSGNNNTNEFCEDFNAPEEYNPWLRNGNKGIQNKLDEFVLKEKEKIIIESKKSPQKNNKWTVTEIRAKQTPELTQEPHATQCDEPLIIETTSGEPTNETSEINAAIIDSYTADIVESIMNHTEPEIDPNNFITVKTKNLRSALPDLITNMDSDDDNDNNNSDMDDSEDDEQRKLIMEAFAEDDVVNDFRKEKKEIIERESEKDVSLHLPGWGSWSGSGIQESKTKKRKFTIKGEKKQRKDHSMGNVIISEKKDAVIAKYQVSELPFPFKNVIQYQNSIRQPIGKTWNPETAVRLLTKPKIVTKMGAVINPIDSDALLKSKVKRPLTFKYYERKSKKAKQTKT